MISSLPERARSLATTGAMVVAIAMASAAGLPLAPHAQAQQPMAAGEDAIAERVATLLAQMTLEEKVSMLSGGTRFATAAIPRLGIPSVRMADGPNGIRANETWPATVFPSSVAVAAMWDKAMTARVGKAVGEEALALDYSIVLGPGLNIQRVPIGGRNFEYYSEDPYLAGRIGVAWTDGLQSTGALATPKHFAANNQEFERKRINAVISERALREIYLPAFKAVVTESAPGLVMSSYNRVNGTHTSEHPWLLTQILRREWGFKGVAVSDWNATHSTVPAITAGLDLEMPAPARYFGDALLDAARKGEVGMDTIDRAAGHVLRMVIRTGLMDGRVKGPEDKVDSAAHRATARSAAQEAITLLRNEGNALPLDPGKLRRIAVIGPNADSRMVQGGGSSEVTAIRIVTPLDGLRAALPKSVKIDFDSGVVNDRFPPVADPRLFSPTLDRKEQGLTQRYWKHGGIEGAPERTMTDDVFMRFYFGHDLAPDPQHNLAMQWTGYFWPPRDGEYRFGMFDHGTTTVMLDGKPIISPATPEAEPPMYDMLGWRARYASVTLKAGRPYAFRMDFLPAGQKFVAYRLGIQPPLGSIEEAVAKARGADAAVVFVGSSTTSETEEADRPNLKLYGDQDTLIEAVAAVNPRTIVVLDTGGPVEMPWLDKVSAVVEGWFLGGETGNALADVLTGKANPSGKLPITFPRRLEDNPTFSSYPGKDLEERYAEGLLVGYRWYDTRGIEPLFPFGFGLSYTRFAFEGLSVKPDAGEAGWTVSFTLRNSGERKGAEVAQLYLGMPAAAGEPVRQLRRFERVELAPGETRQVTLHLDRADLQHWDGTWKVSPGSYTISVGSSSRDLPLTATVIVP